MNPLTNYHVLLPYSLQQLEQERRLAQRREAATFARRSARRQATPLPVEPIGSLATLECSRPLCDRDLPQAA